MYRLAGVARLLLMQVSMQWEHLAWQICLFPQAVQYASGCMIFSMLSCWIHILFVHFSKQMWDRSCLEECTAFTAQSERCQNVHSAWGSRESLRASACIAVVYSVLVLFLKSGMKVTQMYFVLTHWFDFHCLQVFEHASHAEIQFDWVVLESRWKQCHIYVSV